MPDIAYCVKCKAKREMEGTERVITKNNRQALKGKCPVCETVMFKFVKREG